MSDREEEELDAQALELLERIRRGAEQGRRVAATRPNAVQMADGLSAFCGLWDATVAVRLLERFPTRPETLDDIDMLWHPRDGSPAQADQLWVTSLPGPWPRNPARLSLNLLQRLATAAIDHLRGLAVLMREEELVRAPVATARSALEACATASFLMDTSVSQRERLRRAINVLLIELEESRREAVLQEDGEGAAEQVEEITRILAAAEACGMSSKWNRNRRRSFPHLPEADSTQRMIEALLLEGLGASVWRNMSAIAHNRESHTLLLFDPQGVHLSVEMRTHDVALNSISAVVAGTEFVSRVAGYVGWDLSEVIDFHPTLLNVWSLGAGLGDEMIREHLFGDGGADG